MNTTMDSLEIFEKLKASKFTETQAKTLASILGLFGVNEPATKRDLSETELRLQKEIAEIGKEMKEIDLKLSKEIKEMDVRLSKEIASIGKEIKELEVRQSELILNSKSESLRWVIGAMFANTGLIVTLLKLMG